MPSRRASHDKGTEEKGGDEGLLNGVALNGVGGRAFGSGLKTLRRRSSDVRDRVDAWAETLRKQARQHPGRSVALALGAGYMLGGGLFSVLTARLVGAAVRIGVRVAVVPLVTDSIAALGEGLLGQGAGQGDDDESTSAGRKHSGGTAEDAVRTAEGDRT